MNFDKWMEYMLKYKDLKKSDNGMPTLDLLMEQLIVNLYDIFENIARTLNQHNNNVVYDSISSRRIKNDLIRLSNEIKNVYPFYSDELFRLKDSLFLKGGMFTSRLTARYEALLNLLITS